MNTLRVTLYGETIGRLRRRATGGCGFEADAEWIYSRYRPRLGLAWDHDASPRTSAGGSLPVWFENLLPEPTSTLRQKVAASLGVAPEDSFRLLAEIGQDLPGAITVSPSEPAADPSPDDTADPTPGSTASVGPLRFSLAGMQLKFSLVDRDGRLNLPLKGEQGAYIAKLPDDTFRALPAVEHLTMTWAAACGLTVAPTRILPIAEIGRLASLSQFEGDSALIVTRYDRTPTGPVHQEDLAQVFSVPVWNKYTTIGPQMTGEGLVRFVRDALGADAATEMVRRLAFVLASGNSDAHLKNWSLLHPKHGPPTLAPLYDQVSTITWPEFGWGHPDGPAFALPMGGASHMRTFDRAALRTFIGRLGLPAMESVFLDQLRAAAMAWCDLRDRAVRPHAEAVERHWTAVPLLAEVGIRRG